MGLFDEVFSGLEAQAGQHAALYEEVGKLVTESGGASGLLQRFEQQGVPSPAAAASGAAAPITADQIIQVIGPDKITEIASKVGLTEPQVAAGITSLLPVILNHLTTSGTAPEAGSGLEQEALGLLKTKLFGP